MTRRLDNCEHCNSATICDEYPGIGPDGPYRLCDICAMTPIRYVAEGGVEYSAQRLAAAIPRLVNALVDALDIRDAFLAAFHRQAPAYCAVCDLALDDDDVHFSDGPLCETYCEEHAPEEDE